MKTRIALLVGLGLLVGCSQETAAPESQTQAPVAEPADRVQVKIDNAMAGWVASGLKVAAGEELALFADGSLDVEGVVFEPRHLLWYRIGEQGIARNFSANQQVLQASADGEVFLTLRPSGLYWPDPQGTYPPGFSEAPAVPVEFTVDVVSIEGSAQQALLAMAAQGDADAAAAVEVLEAADPLPRGFEYLEYLGRSNVFANGASDGRSGISAATSDDFGIVKMPLDLPLNKSTRLSFDWLYEAIPALGPETDPASHDYLSIALEFDNGQDLTWMWSKELPADSHFGCPLPWWDSRETHYVLQSGEEGLGEWFSHDRNVLDDYVAAVDGEPPSRIVGVWFIAVSVFGRQPGAASFANVAISNGDQRFKVFAD